MAITPSGLGAFVFVLCLLPVSSSQQEPKFTNDLPMEFDFSNSKGGKLPCMAYGQPEPNISWLNADGSVVMQVPKLRHVTTDGTLVFPPFPAENFRQDVHGVSYRCAATNSLGTVVSNEVKVRGVVSQAFDVHVYDVYAIKGNTAVMRCHIPKFLQRYVNVTAWIKDSVVSITLDSTFDSNSKYVLLSSGELIVKDVDAADVHTTYRCQVTHHLTGEVKTSSSPGRLIVTESEGKVPPKIVFHQAEIVVRKNDRAVLPCVANGHPPPLYTWYQQTNSGELEPFHMGRNTKITSGLLIIERVHEINNGTFVCTATNEIKADKIVTHVFVIESLRATINPGDATVDVDQALRLNCKFHGSPVDNVLWLKNGKKLSGDEVLQSSNDSIFISKMSLDLSGIYQCFARNAFYSTFASAVVKLGDSMPVIVKGFEEQVLNPSESITIECIANGNPIPELNWYLDNTEIMNNGRNYIVTRLHETKEQEVISTLRVSSLRIEDGGLYKCSAKTNKGSVSHAARISVYGKLGVRKNVKYSATEDDVAQLDCPVYGYPVNDIQWEKDSRIIPFHVRHVLHTNGTLRIKQVQRDTDSGRYTCSAKGSGEVVKGAVDLVILVPPKITPFSFQDELIREGARARVQCVIREGDNPLKITWIKDGLPLPQDQGVTIHDLDEFSSILMISSINPRHNGNYTCVASNPAGTAQHTASLFVNVSPKITPFSFPDNVVEGKNFVRVSCVVHQGDLPITFQWLKNGVTLTPKENLTIRKIDDYSSILTLEHVVREQSGNYTCLASNSAATVSHSSRLFIHVPLRWILQPNDANVKSGDSLVVSCKAEGFPEPSVTWKKSTSKYDLLEQSEFVKSDRDIYVFDNGTLVFENIKRTHEGFYICLAENRVQKTLTHVISVKVKAAPEFSPPIYEMVAVKGDAIEIKCEAAGNWPISYSWTVSNHAIKQQTGTRYLIEEKHDETQHRSWSVLGIKWVDRKDSTTFECNAKNEIGESKQTIHLKVQEIPDAPEIESPVKVMNQTVDLTWKLTYNGNSEVKRFIVQYKKDVERWNNKVETVIINGSKTSVKISHLKPATMYNFRVMAENDIGNGSFSEFAKVRTEETAPAGPPENVDIESLDANTLRVTWKPPKKHLWNGAIRGYFIGHKIHHSAEDYVFTSLEVPDDYTEELIYQLIDLHMYTQYDVIVQAYNSKGKGPQSEPILAMTSEDVPSASPQDIRCSSLSSKSIYILWQSPPSETINGILRGYKVLFKPVNEWYSASVQSKITESPKITINNLEVNTNYSIQVLAFTKMGDGAKSLPIYCKTHEDVPEPPESIKVLPSSSDSVVVAWKPPHRSNGALTKYNVYYKPIEDEKQVDIQAQSTEELLRNANIHQSSSNSQYVELKGLKKNKKYAFWVTASSAIGESSGSSVVAQTVADSIVAAKSASFDNTIKTPWQEDIVLPCLAVGVPSPNRKWSFEGQFLKESNRIKITADGSVIINKIASEDTGNYTCAIYNEHGRDEVSYMVAVLVPPSAPIVDIVSKTQSSLKLQWKTGLTGGESIRGYLLHYKEDNGIWKTKEIRPDQVLYTLDNLSCGTTYQIYMEAFNNIGTGSASNTVTVATEGAEVTTPTKDQIIREGSTFVTVHLEAWPSTGCPVKTFSAEYKPTSGKDWVVAGSNIRPTQKKLVISGLSPATWYVLRLQVETNNAPTIAEYKFATHTATGGTLAPDTFDDFLAPVYIFYLDPMIFIPAVALLIVVIIASVVICFYVKRREGSVGTPSDISDTTLHTGTNTWVRNAHTLPRNRFGHSSAHSTLSRRCTDPSPYATSHLTDTFHPSHGKVRLESSIPLFHNDSFQQPGNFVRLSDGQLCETKFTFPMPPGELSSNTANSDGYDPPPLAHMIK